MLDALAARGRFVQALLRGANELPQREENVEGLLPGLSGSDPSKLGSALETHWPNQYG